MVNKTSTHQICFNILNNYDIFGHKLLSIKKKKLASKFEYFPDFSIHVELFILRRKVYSPKKGYSHVAFLMFVLNRRTLKIELSLPFT